MNFNVHANSDFIWEFERFQNLCGEWAKSKGWADESFHDSGRIALCHSELSECLEAMREGNPPDKHIPEFDARTVELADTVIRIMDLAALRKLPLARAIVAKMAYNDKREYKHGGKKF